jgi:hypothetical protein
LYWNYCYPFIMSWILHLFSRHFIQCFYAGVWQEMQ